MDPAGLAVDDELGEHGCEPRVARRVADVVLARRGTGEWTTISSVAGSKVAVVSRLWTSLPWPVSVIAKQPCSSRTSRGTRWWWRLVPSSDTAPPKRPHWTPALTKSERSRVTEHLERGHRLAVAGGPALVLREADGGIRLAGQGAQLGGDPGPVLVHRERCRTADRRSPGRGRGSGRAPRRKGRRGGRAARRPGLRPGSSGGSLQGSRWPWTSGAFRSGPQEVVLVVVSVMRARWGCRWRWWSRGRGRARATPGRSGSRRSAARGRGHPRGWRASRRRRRGTEPTRAMAQVRAREGSVVLVRSDSRSRPVSWSVTWSTVPPTGSSASGRSTRGRLTTNR